VNYLADFSPLSIKHYEKWRVLVAIEENHLDEDRVVSRPECGEQELDITRGIPDATRFSVEIPFLMLARHMLLSILKLKSGIWIFKQQRNSDGH
jgi:hypothetical protein